MKLPPINIALESAPIVRKLLSIDSKTSLALVATRPDAWIRNTNKAVEETYNRISTHLIYPIIFSPAKKKAINTAKLLLSQN